MMQPVHVHCHPASLLVIPQTTFPRDDSNVTKKSNSLLYDEGAYKGAKSEKVDIQR